MSETDMDADKIPTLTDLVQPGTESKPRPAVAPEPAMEVNEGQLDIPLDTEAGHDDPGSRPGYDHPADAPFDTAIAEAENLLGMGTEVEEADETAAPLDMVAVLDVLEPRIEALVDEALDRRARQTREEIVGSVMQALRDEFEHHSQGDVPGTEPGQD